MRALRNDERPLQVEETVTAPHDELSNTCERGCYISCVLRRCRPLYVQFRISPWVQVLYSPAVHQRHSAGSRAPLQLWERLRLTASILPDLPHHWLLLQHWYCLRPVVDEILELN